MTARHAAGAGGLVGLLLAAGTLVACGDEPAPKPVRLAITAPTDAALVHDEVIEVRGTVRPARARVLVLGRRATVTGGEFRARVPLGEGANVIDVGASARGAEPTWDAVRVVREILVSVPDLAGADRDDAVDRLRAVGLRPEVQQKDGLLDPLLPDDWRVCEIRPDPGAELPKGARVQLTVSKTC